MVLQITNFYEFTNFLFVSIEKVFIFRAKPQRNYIVSARFEE